MELILKKIPISPISLVSYLEFIQQSTCGVDDKIDAGIIGLQSPRKLNLWEGLFRSQNHKIRNQSILTLYVTNVFFLA